MLQSTVGYFYAHFLSNLQESKYDVQKLTLYFPCL